jgi:hypothetical protein
MRLEAEALRLEEELRLEVIEYVTHLLYRGTRGTIG